MPLRSLARHFAPALAAFLCLSAPAQASPPACTCQNLESLQQDYQNAVYLEAHKRQLAEVLAAAERAQTDLNANQPSHPNAGRSVIDVAGRAGADFDAANLRLPFGRIAGYTGPDDVDMPFGTCQQDPRDLAALEQGSPCQAMAEAALAHETSHRELCSRLGASAYWGRPQSELALEEAEHYRVQAATLKVELQRVLEAAKVELKGEILLTFTVPGAIAATYRFAVQSDDISQTASGDPWTMSAPGRQITTIESAVIAGMTCTPSGSVDAEFDARLTTDGLTFGLDILGGITGGNPAIHCPMGGGGMGFPPPDPITGRLASNLPLKAGTTSLTGDFSAPMRAAVAGMGSVTHEGELALSITCPAN